MDAKREPFLPETVIAGTARGSMVMFFFGCAWMIWWSLIEELSCYLIALVLLIEIVLFLNSLKLFRQFKGFLKSAPSAERSRIRRWFWFIFALEWIGLGVAGALLEKVGLHDWFIPVMMFIIGIHFLPLARLFKVPVYYVVGIILVLNSVLYPLLTKEGPADSRGWLVTGLTLTIAGAFLLFKAKQKSAELKIGASPS